MNGEINPADIIAAIGAAVASILGGVALVIAALSRRAVQEVHENTKTVNGRTLAQTVERIEADTLEQTVKLDEINSKVNEGRTPEV